MKWILILTVGVLLVSGCTQTQSSYMEPYAHETPTSTENKAKLECVFLCESGKDKMDLSNGPCLSDDNPNWNTGDWVCDVAHSPRTAEDNLPENQCQAFRSGEAHHFVEVDPTCKLIRAV